MTIEEIKPGCTYLARKGHSSTIYEIQVMEISKTSFKIKYESGHISWVRKVDFDWEYSIIEQI